MKRQPPHPQWELRITKALQDQLCSAAVMTGFEKEDWEIAQLAVNDWLARNLPDAIPLPQTQGYQWKQLFLPDGTVLRTIYRGKNHHCMVEHDTILFNGKSVSPNQFVNQVGGERRNAWDAIWLLFPGTTEWKQAQSVRPKRFLKKPRTRSRPAS